MGLSTFLGIDVGSVTTKLAILDENGKYIDSYMLRTAGQPVKAVQEGMRAIKKQSKQEYDILGVGTTGSGRNLAGALVGADVNALLNYDKELKARTFVAPTIG